MEKDTIRLPGIQDETKQELLREDSSTIINKKCQVFTPPETVQKLLDSVGYSQELYGKKVLENSCGDGNILAGIVDRYIVDGLKNGISRAKIRKGLQEDLVAVEIDEAHILTCGEKLRSVTQKYGMDDVTWNLKKGDFLAMSMPDAFDFVIGNPPYVAYVDLEKNTRSFLRNTYKVCQQGKFDYCYAFIQASIDCLKERGKLSYLVPVNIFKNQFATALREFILPHLTEIYDFKRMKLFKDKLTYSAIIVCDKGKGSKSILYHDVMGKKRNLLDKAYLSGKWMFLPASHGIDRLHEVRFGDYFYTGRSIATLSNKVFLLENPDVQGELVFVGKHRVERSVLRKAASPRSLQQGKKEYIIFPYVYQGKKLCRFTENEFSDRFPFAVRYLSSHREQLDARDSDLSAKWFEYGRSQALAHLNQEKLMLSILVTGQVVPRLLDAETIPTSGMYIVPKREYGLRTAEKILRSDRFLAYVKKIGVISNGNSYRISPRDVNAYVLSYEELKSYEEDRISGERESGEIDWPGEHIGCRRRFD